MSQQDGKCPFCGEFLDASSPLCPSCKSNILEKQPNRSARYEMQPRFPVEGSYGYKIKLPPPSVAITPKNLLIGLAVLLLAATVPIVGFLGWSWNHHAINLPAIIGQKSPSGKILCQADWSSGMNGWTGTKDWQTLPGQSAMLDNGNNTADAQNPPTLLAPCHLDDVPNYQVDAQIQVQNLGPGDINQGPGFGLYVRYRPENDEGYSVAFGAPTASPGGSTALNSLSIAPASNITSSLENPISFSPGTADAHTYTVQVKGNHIKVLIDGQQMTDLTDNKSLAGGSVGFWDKEVELTISSFTVSAL